MGMTPTVDSLVRQISIHLPNVPVYLPSFSGCLVANGLFHPGIQPPSSCGPNAHTESPRQSACGCLWTVG